MASSSKQNRVIHLGPENPSLLRFQNIHVSEHICDGWDHPILKVRKSQFIPAGLDGILEEILPHLELVGFTGIAHVCQFPLDLSLITTLVEKWRLKTYTFHLPPGECTITLQDISVLLGLWIDGRPVIAPIRGNYVDIVEKSLRIRPSCDAFVGSFLKTSWLDQHFTHVAMHAQNPLQITQFVRAYMLQLIGGFMLSDHSNSRVLVKYLPLLQDLTITSEYSLGSVVLGVLYRNPCMATNIDRYSLGGLAVLLVMWAWDRFPFLAPGNPLHT
ncbi:serine/threonine-protein phosphatase 7 long form homolog [Abrus precatorius]|uniref:Serine/threonine-protein phosphatase 7 long form homolog n=1 Tax=Abrus precatorius TaxID=3816 RepID=A0A8B8K2J2_ABRPR|nr:serine/threonine-protein phosphatase 7 long form homolog [Abrus precatorius]